MLISVLKHIKIHWNQHSRLIYFWVWSSLCWCLSFSEMKNANETLKFTSSVLKSARSSCPAVSNNSVGSSADGDLLLPDATHIRQNSSSSMREWWLGLVSLIQEHNSELCRHSPKLLQETAKCETHQYVLYLVQFDAILILSDNFRCTFLGWRLHRGLVGARVICLPPYDQGTHRKWHPISVQQIMSVLLVDSLFLAYQLRRLRNEYGFLIVK